MSWADESDGVRDGRRDFERRGRYEFERYHDFSSDEGRGYRRGYDGAQQEEYQRLEEQDRRERERERREQGAIAEERARQAQWEAEREALEQEEPEPEPAEREPVVEAIQQAVTEFEQNCAENSP